MKSLWTSQPNERNDNQVWLAWTYDCYDFDKWKVSLLYLNFHNGFSA